MLDKLNKSTADSTAVLEYWKYSASTLDSVFNTGDTMYYNGTDYIAATNKALWVPYSEFVKTAEASVFPPHATKAILEDGLLGDIQDSTASGKLDYIAPAVSENKQGKDVVLTFANGEDYLGKVSALYLNGDWRELGEKYYNIAGNTITLKKDLLHVGENALKIESAGYKPQTVKFAYNKVNETGLSLSVANTAAGEPVVITVENSNGDFLSHLKSVTLTSNGKDDAVYTKGYEGGDAVYYEIAEDNKSLTLHNVKPGSYQLTLSAEYYENLMAEFTMEKVDTPDTKTAPEISSYEQKSISDFYGTQYPVYRFSFNVLNATNLKEYLNAVTSVKVNDTTLTKNTSSFSFDEKKFRLYSTGSENGGAVYDYDRLDLFASLFEKPGTYTITLTAPDYADVSYELTVSGSTNPTEPTTPTEPGESEVKVPTELPTITKGSNAYCTLTFSNAEKWLAQKLTVTVNDVAYDKTGSIYNLDNGGAYYIEENNISLKIPYETFDTKTSMLVISDGTSTINFTVTMPGSFILGAEPTIAFTK